MERTIVRRSRCLLGPIRTPAKQPRPEKQIDNIIPAPKRTFQSRPEAYAWAVRYAEESCYMYHRWEIVPLGRLFAVAVVSLNTGDRDGWAE